jgi:hypothetical protein
MRLFMTALVAVTLVGAAGATTSPSGLRGLVMRGPVTPVCAAEQPCDAPAKGVVLVFSNNDRVVGRATTNTQGWYRVALRPGVYAVRTGSTQTVGLRLSPVRATVSLNHYRRVDFSIDTGIR